jgi:polar amino acid transport system substrate-binding protein
VLDKENAAVMEVVQGKADAFIYDPLSVYRNQARHPETTRAILRPFREETWAVGLRQGDTSLRSEIDRFIDDFRAAGGFEQLGAEFLPDETRAFAAEGIRLW